jgi:hypothetical protein
MLMQLLVSWFRGWDDNEWFLVALPHEGTTKIPLGESRVHGDSARFPDRRHANGSRWEVGFEILLVLQRRRDWTWYNSIVDAYIANVTRSTSTTYAFCRYRYQNVNYRFRLQLHFGFFVTTWKWKTEYIGYTK